MRKLRVLDLFSGIGGFSLGLERTGGFETAAFCECEPFARKVLAKHWPNAPCFPDVRELKGQDIDGPVDVICGGWPCQPFSTAGQRRGKEDDRHLWPEVDRLVAELRPAWVIGENVAGHISMGLDDVLSDLEGQGYTARPFVIPACAVDAPHRRDRVWIVAHGNNAGQPASARRWEDNWNQSRNQTGRRGENVAFSDSRNGQSSESERPGIRAAADRQRTDADTCCAGFEREVMADAGREGLQGRQKAGNIGGKRSRRKEQPERCADMPRAAWLPEPGVGGMADGLPGGMDGPCRWPDEPSIPRVAKGVKNRANRLKALGNAVVPPVVEMIGRAILEAENQT